MNVRWETLLSIFLLGLLCLFLPLARLDGDALGSVKYLMMTLFTGVAFLLWLWRSTRETSFTLYTSPIFPPLLLFLALHIITIFWASYRHEPFKRLVHILPAFAITFLLPQVVNWKAAQKAIAWAVLTGLSLCWFIGVLQFHGLIPTDWEQAPWEHGLGKRVYSTLWNPNFLATTIVMFLPLMMGLFFLIKPRFSRYCLGTLIVNGFACLLYTNSWPGTGSGIFGLLIGIVILVKSRKHPILKERLRPIVILDFIIVVLVCSVIMKGFIDEKGEQVVGELTGWYTRILDWNTGFQMAKDAPLAGFGAGNFAVFSNKYQAQFANSTDWREMFDQNPSFSMRNPKRAHNIYMTTFFELGALGMVALLWLIANIYRTLWKGFWVSETPWERLLSLALMVGMAAYWMQGNFSPSLQVSTSQFYIALATGLAACLGPANRKIVDWGPLHQGKNLILGVGAVIVVLFLYISWAPIPGQKYFFAGMRQEALGNYVQALQMYQKSVTYAVEEPAIYYKIGDCFDKLGDVPQAIKAYEKAMSYRPYFAFGHIGLGQLMVKAGQIDKGIELYREAMWLEPREPQVYYRLADWLTTLGRREKAFEVLRQGKQYVEAEMNLDSLYWLFEYSHGNEKEALNNLKLLADQHPESVYLRYNLREIERYESLTDTNESVDLIDSCITPLEFEAIKNRLVLGTRMLGQGAITQAEMIFKNIVELYPHYVPAISNLGVIYMNQGKLELAREQWEKSLAIEPQHSTTRKNLEDLDSMLKQWDEQSRAFAAERRCQRVRTCIPSETLEATP